MKNTLFIFLLLVGIWSCSDNNDPAPTPGFDGNTELTFNQEGGKQSINIKNTKDIMATVAEAGKGWCTAETVGPEINITATYNNTQNERKTEITIEAGQETFTLHVTQKGIGGISLDDKLTISGGEASSEHTAYEDSGFEKSYDSDFNSYWHSEWDALPPHTATYNLNNAEKLDYIMYYPRNGGGNGNFGEVEIYVSTEDNPEFTKVMDYNHGKSGSPAKITLPSSVNKPKAVKFVILSGLNNNASCSEMEFYASKSGSVSVKEIPLGGNSYVTAGESGNVTDGGFTGWTSDATVFSTFFRVNTTGDLKLYLSYRADGDGSIIEASCKGQTFEVNLPKPRHRTDTTIFIGSIEKVEPGYIQVDFTGKTLRGESFGTPTSLLVGGTATQSMNYVGDFSYYWGRRGPSVHMGYPIPTSGTAEWFYNEVTVPVGYDPIGSYYMANGFSEGYFGMQVNSSVERRVLFSVWSPYETDDPSQIPDEDRVVLIKKGEGVTVNDFGNEGSGGQSYLIYNWSTGNTYKFLNRIRPIEGGYSEYTAYFYAPELDKWQLIAQWKRPHIYTYYTGAHSFLENFNNNVGHLSRKALYTNQWVYTTDGNWVELVNGRFTVDATGSPGWRMDYKGGIEGNGFFLQNCGFFNDYVEPNSTFERTASGKQPDIDWSELE